MHYWGEWPDHLFNDVDSAAYEIGQFCRRWGRIQVSQTKEKFGTARVYCSFGCTDLHELIWPGYPYLQVKTPWLQWLLTFPILRPFRKIIFRYQVLIYHLAYRLALKKYSHIRQEILVDADWGEYIYTKQELLDIIKTVKDQKFDWMCKYALMRERCKKILAAHKAYKRRVNR